MHQTASNSAHRNRTNTCTMTTRCAVIWADSLQKCTIASQCMASIRLAQCYSALYRSYHSISIRPMSGRGQSKIESSPYPYQGIPQIFKVLVVATAAKEALQVIKFQASLFSLHCGCYLMRSIKAMNSTTVCY